MTENLMIFLRPRPSIREIIRKNNKFAEFLLIVLVGFSYSLDKASISGAGDTLEFYYLIPICLIAGIPYGFLQIYFWSSLLFMFGILLNGKASFQEIVTAVSWSSLPVVIGLLIWIPELYFFGGYELFQSDMPTLSASESLSGLYVYFLYFEGMLSACWYLLLIPMLSEVQKITIKKSLINAFLPLIIVLPVYFFI